ncbi:hypothetical protein SUDANB6_00226 [Streptomyces sp. enrichment culture]
MVIRPYGYGLWERTQQELDARIEAAGASNACFPLFIPQSYPTREAEHVEGTPADLVAARSTLTGEHPAACVGA